MTVPILRALGWMGRAEKLVDRTFRMDPFEWTKTRQRELDDAIEEWDNEGGGRSPQTAIAPAHLEMPPGVPEYLNDLGVERFQLVHWPFTVSACRRRTTIRTFI